MLLEDAMTYATATKAARKKHLKGAAPKLRGVDVPTFGSRRYLEEKAAKAKEPKKLTKTQETAMEKIAKLYGKNAVRKLTDTPEGSPSIVCVPTLFQELDDLLTGRCTEDGDLIAGSGRGIPTGRIIEVYGPESVGKSSFMIHLIKAFQRAGKVAAYVDAEHALDTDYARACGVSLKDLLISQPDNGEQALNIMLALVSDKLADLVVVDSVAALVTKKEVEGQIGDQHVGAQARMMSQAMRKLVRVAAKSGATVIFINQIRMKIGVFFGNPETTPGGNALKFYASVRLDMRKVGVVKRKSKEVGIRSKMRVIKSKVAIPFRTVYLDIQDGKGIQKVHRDDPNLSAAYDGDSKEKPKAKFGKGKKK